MAKRSAVDQLVERINTDLATRTNARAYAAKHGAIGSVLEGMDADLEELRRIRDYVTGEQETAPAPKRKPRKKPGLPPAAHEQ